MKIVKTVLKILGILLAVILLLVTIALFFANELVKDAIESTVPDLTGVSCKVGRVAV